MPYDPEEVDEAVDNNLEDLLEKARTKRMQSDAASEAAPNGVTLRAKDGSNGGVKGEDDENHKKLMEMMGSYKSGG
jgi:hypothetical protein